MGAVNLRANGHAPRSKSPRPRQDSGCAKPDSAVPRSALVIPYMPFPTHLLPTKLRAFVSEGAAATHCDESFYAVPMLAVLGAAIGLSRAVRVKSSWVQSPIVWAVVVADSGMTKTPAFGHLLDPVHRLQEQAFTEFDDATSMWEGDKARFDAEKDRWKQSARNGSAGEMPAEPARPLCKRYVTDDVTTEAIAWLLSQNPRGMLAARNELSGLFAFDRYSGGKGGGDVARWLECFDAGTLIVDRKGEIARGGAPLHVSKAAVGVVGTIQPQTLQKCLTPEHVSNGLASRFLFCMPPAQPVVFTDAEITDQTRRDYATIVGRLYGLDPDFEGNRIEPRKVGLSTESRRLFIEFFNHSGQEQMELDYAERAAWAKLRGYVIRIALVIHLARWASDEAVDQFTVDETSMQAAVGIVEWLSHESRRVYGMLGGDGDSQHHSQVAAWIDRTRDGQPVTASDVSHGIRTFRNKPESAASVLASMADAGLGEWRVRDGGRTKEFILDPNWSLVRGSAAPPDEEAVTGAGEDVGLRDGLD